MNSIRFVGGAWAALALCGAALTGHAASSTPAPAAQARIQSSAQVQANSAAAARAASAASAPSKRVPQPQSAAEAAESAQAPGELRPESPVVPQIRIALGADRGGSAPSANGPGIDDSAARCQAQRNAAAREACLDRRIPSGPAALAAPPRPLR